MFRLWLAEAALGVQTYASLFGKLSWLSSTSSTVEDLSIGLPGYDSAKWPSKVNLITMDLGVVTLFSPSAVFANRLVEAAVSYGSSLGVYVAACVCDTTGRAIATLTHPNAASHCAGIAQDKASISAAFRLSSDELYQSIEGNEALKLGLATRRGFALFGGGMPVFVDGQVIGGIGVSGGSETQDIDCVRHALAGG